MKTLLKSILNNKNSGLNEKNKVELLISLHKLLLNGFTLYESFKFINMHFKYRNSNLGPRIISAIKRGGSCHEILKLLNYPSSLVTQIYLAERYGDICQSLYETAQYMKNNLSAKQLIIKTLQYPIILIFIFVTMLSIIKVTVLPQFDNLFTTLDVKTSQFQIIITFLIKMFPNFIIFLSVILIILYLLLRKYLHLIPIPKQIKLFSSIPVFKSYFKIVMTYKIATEFSLFYKNGVSLQDIVKIYLNQNSSSFHKYLGNQLLTKSEKGLSLNHILKEEAYLKDDFIKFIEQGEKSGKLDLELLFYSQILLEQFKNKITRETKLIQPIIFFIIGFFIISLYLVIMLPIFELLQTIK